MKVQIEFNYDEQELIRTVLKSRTEAEASFVSKVDDYLATITLPVGEKRDRIEIVLARGSDERVSFSGTAKDFGIDLNPPQPARS